MTEEHDTPDAGTADDSRDSRIVPVARLRAVRPLAAVFVLLNALLTSLATPAAVNLMMMLPFALILGVVAAHRSDPAGLPGLIGRAAQGFLDQIAERPAEFWLLLGIVLAACGQRYVLPDSWLVFSFVVTLAACFLIRGTAVTHQAGWQYLMQTGKMYVVGADPADPRPDREMRHVIDSERDRKTWEHRQHQRWQDWMKEEVDRLDDDDPPGGGTPGGNQE